MNAYRDNGRWSLNYSSFDRLLSEQNPFTDPHTFDLRNCGFATPAAVVQLAAACQLIHEGGHRAIIRLDGNSDLAKYLVRVNFVPPLRRITTFNPDLNLHRLGTVTRAFGTSPQVIELTKVSSSTALPLLLMKILQTLQTQLKYPERDALDISIAISEMVQNTIEHAGGNACGFLAMQVYRPRSKMPSELLHSWVYQSMPKM
jgi:hypothetical protein